MDDDKRLLLANKAWAQDKLELRPDYFVTLARGQQPAYLWIGCSDSRVPAEEITGADPGEIFVHRNVANLVIATDLNVMSVVQYAIEVLKVRHVIVCGHYGCGGVRAALSRKDIGPLNKWLRAIKDVYHQHRDEVLAYAEFDRQADRLAEFSVIEQVNNLARTWVVQRAWREGRPVVLHGWIFVVHDGLLKDLVTLDEVSAVDDVYRFDFDGN